MRISILLIIGYLSLSSATILAQETAKTSEAKSQGIPPTTEHGTQAKDKDAAKQLPLTDETATESDVAVIVQPSNNEPGINSPSQTESETLSTQGLRYVCKLGDLQRRIEVEYLETMSKLPCIVNYYKDIEMPGNVQTLWQSDHEQGYCEQQTENLVAKLGNWGWNCSAHK